MKRKLITGTVLVFLFLSCSNNKSNTPAGKTDSMPPQVQGGLTEQSGKQENADSIYAYIKKITQKNDSVFIEADDIQFLTGDAAVEAAKKNHEADTSYDDKGKITSIFVDNDYYILNESKELRLLPLSKNVIIETVDMAGAVSTVKTTLSDFISKHNKDTFPFILKIKASEVIEIKEVFLP